MFHGVLQAVGLDVERGSGKCDSADRAGSSIDYGDLSKEDVSGPAVPAVSAVPVGQRDGADVENDIGHDRVLVSVLMASMVFWVMFGVTRKRRAIRCRPFHTSRIGRRLRPPAEPGLWTAVTEAESSSRVPDVAPFDVAQMAWRPPAKKNN